MVGEKNILEFCTAEWGLGLGTVSGVPALYPAQTFILKCYYGLELDSSSKRDIIIKDQFNEVTKYIFNEKEYFNYLYNEGRINVPELTHPFDDVVLICGRRSGKTVMCSCIISYEVYKLLNKYSPQEYFHIMPESDIRFTCVSTSKETASELFNNVTGHIERSEFFKRFRLSSTKQSIYLQTQREIDKYGRGSRASVSVHVAPCSAKGLRGHGNMVVGLDEMAHFFEDEKAKGLVSGSDKNDRSIYNAVTPSTAKFKGIDGKFCGKVICISSPSVKSGKFFEEYERSFKPEVTNLLMIQAPTWEIDCNLSSDYLRGKYNENPLVFRCEHGAIFDDRLKGWIEDPEVIRQNIVPGLIYKDSSNQRIPHFMGVDIGLKTDGTALCICHHVQEVLNGMRQTLIELDFSQVRYAKDEKKEHFIPEELADWIASVCQKFYVVKGLMDQWYGMSIVPILKSKGLKQFEYREFNENSNSIIFQNLLTNFISRTMRLPEKDRIQKSRDSDTELIKELLTLQAYQKSKYIIRVEAPDREGAHDDLSSALTRAVLLATEYKEKGYGLSLGTAGMISQGRSLRISRSKEVMRTNLNRPTKGAMSAREIFSRSVYGRLNRG